MQKYLASSMTCKQCSLFFTATGHIVRADEKLSGNSRVSHADSPAGSKLFGSSSPSQRSPLAPRNSRASTSTPRDIILRKQLAQVEKFRGLDIPASEAMMTKRHLESSWDKENL